jgi:selenophosphate synthase
MPAAKPNASISIRELARLTGWDRKKIAEIMADLGAEKTLEEIIAGFVRAVTPETGPGLFSLSELANLTGLDRATVTDRLDGVASVPGPKGSKRYSLTDALPALIAGRDLSLDAARLRKLQAEAKTKELHLNRETKKVVDYNEVKGELQEIFKALNRRLLISYWRENAGKLKKAKTAAALAKLGQEGQEQIFNVLRNHYKALLGSD